MGFRFRRSIGLLPGIRINLGKRGISATIGVRGAGVTVGPSGTHLNVGLPGTGLSFRTRLDAPERPSRTGIGVPTTPAANPEFPSPDPVPAAHVIEFKSVDVVSLGSESLSRVGALVDKLRRQRAAISLEITQAENDASKARRMASSFAWLRQRTAPAALASRREYAADCEERIRILHNIRASLVLDVEFNVGDEAMKRFLDVVACFDQVSQCERVWDVTSAERIDRARTRSAASQSLDVRPVSFRRVPDDIMATHFRPPLFTNDNGADLLFYPAFIAAQIATRSALLDIREIDIRVEPVTFVVDHGTVPSDAEVVGNTWRYVNKNGQPDRRFTNNPSIPLARYAKIFFQGAGLNEAWMVSKAASGLAFGEAVRKYKAALKPSESEPEGIAPPSVDEWPDPELPEKVPPPIRDWKTPSILYGSMAALAAVAVAIVLMLYPRLVTSISDSVGWFRAPQQAVQELRQTVATTPPLATSAVQAKPAASLPLAPAEIAELQRLLKRAGYGSRAGRRQRGPSNAAGGDGLGEEPQRPESGPGSSNSGCSPAGRRSERPVIGRGGVQPPAG